MKKYLVVGSTKGIELALTQQLIKEGNKVFGVAHCESDKWNFGL